MYWDKILKEVLDKKVENKNLNKIETKTYKNKKYKLGGDYKDIYFTYREAQCMSLIFKHKKNKDIAMTLNLSTRTIDFYLRNMKSKLGCHTKNELINLVTKSDFLKNIDFIY